MILSSHGLIGSSIVQFVPDADYQAVLDYATTQGYTLPSAPQQIKQNDLVVDLKNAGVWSDLDLFYVFATDGDSDFASINWKDVNNFQCSQVNSPNFTTNVGFWGDGASSYLNTNYNLNTDSLNFQLLSNSLHYYYSNSTGDVHHGVREGNDGNQLLYGEDLKRHQGDALVFSVLDTGTSSFFSSIRNGISTEQYINNTLNRTRSNTPTSLPNYDYYILALNTAGTVGINGTAKISLFALGDQISNSTMYNAWTTYFNAI